MDKNKIDRFINKYHLAGKVNSVKWKSGEDKLTATFVTEDKSLLGQVSADNFSFEECELGIYDTDQLQKLLGVLSDNIKMSLVKFGKKPLSLKVENENASVDYVLSDLSVIPEPPTIKKIPKFETKIKITNMFINAFIKGKSALPESDSFTIIKSGDECKIVIGYSNTTTNRVIIDTEYEECELASNISFNANYFKDILSANRECTNAFLEVSSEGLARINFKVDDFDAVYYMVANNEVD